MIATATDDSEASDDHRCCGNKAKTKTGGTNRPIYPTSGRLKKNSTQLCGHVYCRFVLRFALTYPQTVDDHGRWISVGRWLFGTLRRSSRLTHVGSWWWMPMSCAPGAKDFKSWEEGAMFFWWQPRVDMSWHSRLQHTSILSSREGLQRPVFSWQHSSAHRFHGWIC